MFTGKVQIVMLAAMLAAFSFACDAASRMYRWTDANGNPVVSDRPPPEGTPYTEISANYSPDRRRQATRATPSDRPSANPEMPVTTDRQVPALCERARDHIDKLQNAPSIAVADGAGNVRVLSDEERAAQLVNAQRMAEQHCEG